MYITATGFPLYRKICPTDPEAGLGSSLKERNLFNDFDTDWTRGGVSPPGVCGKSGVPMRGVFIYRAQSL